MHSMSSASGARARVCAFVAAQVATLRKNAAELTADRTQSQQELDAINERPWGVSRASRCQH